MISKLVRGTLIFVACGLFTASSASGQTPPTKERAQQEPIYFDSPAVPRLLKELGDRPLTTKVVKAGAAEVIVIYRPDGSCSVCIGSSRACKEACPPTTTKPKT